jgi:hypothetical protein
LTQQDVGCILGIQYEENEVTNNGLLVGMKFGNKLELKISVLVTRRGIA